jgi:predicted nucleotidyltransferase
MHRLIENALPEISRFSEKYHVERLYLFGSATQSSFKETSDVDFLVTFKEIPVLEYADNFFDFKFELEDLLNKEIDLISEKSLTNPYLIKSIDRTKVLLYDRRDSKIFA